MLYAIAIWLYILLFIIVIVCIVLVMHVTCVMWSNVLSSSVGHFIGVIYIAATSILRPKFSVPMVTGIGRFHCRVKHWSSDTQHVRTLDLEAGSSDKGWGYVKWYLGVTSLHIVSENPCKKFNAAPGPWENGFRKQLCSDKSIHFRPVMLTPPYMIRFLPDSRWW